ncbi:hypothetical protein ACU5JM_01680 (plasmid) [Rhodococcus erythropolis]|uniref:hypothetical protein n=1 Tax=Rhodococcus erythropolis TaxID=1833 RepID=UPI00406BB77C
MFVFDFVLDLVDSVIVGTFDPRFTCREEYELFVVDEVAICRRLRAPSLLDGLHMEKHVGAEVGSVEVGGPAAVRGPGSPNGRG